MTHEYSFLLSQAEQKPKSRLRIACVVCPSLSLSLSVLSSSRLQPTAPLPVLPPPVHGSSFQSRSTGQPPLSMSSRPGFSICGPLSFSLSLSLAAILVSCILYFGFTGSIFFALCLNLILLSLFPLNLGHALSQLFWTLRYQNHAVLGF
jgi:hypothetical protein